MESSTSQQPYHDTPPSSPNSSPRTPNLITKPLPPLPQQAPAYEPYRDDPSDQTHADPTIPTTSDENIPLAYLLSNPYPHDAPPSYSVAIRQTQHHLNTSPLWAQPSSSRAVVVEIDPESGEVVARTDDNRHGVETVVAMFVVAIMLLCLSGVLGWMAFGW